MYTITIKVDPADGNRTRLSVVCQSRGGSAVSNRDLGRFDGVTDAARCATDEALTAIDSYAEAAALRS